ncbi:MAG: ArsR family transcriptional regulator [Staphylothermus sp.]|nr:ArsR family transcriptional regulator [Staphylothermus sp.]
MSRLSDVWRNHPLFRLVLEELINKPSGLSEKDLYEIIKKEHRYDVSKPELYEVLLRLELRGYIRVERIRKDLVVKLSPDIDRILQ